MCGIFCSVLGTCPGVSLDQRTLNELGDLCSRLRIVNGHRGPDAQRSERVTLSDGDQKHTSPHNDTQTCGCSISLELYASELRLRGDHPVEQPHIRDENILCWNGEVFEGLDIDQRENDGVRLFEAIEVLPTPEDIPKLFGTIEGPYAFVYFHARSRRLYFGRDPLGRRSLLMHTPTTEKPYLILASVSAGYHALYDLVEVSSESFHCLDLGRHQSGQAMGACFSQLSRQDSTREEEFAVPKRVNTVIPRDDIPKIASIDQDVIPEEIDKAVNGLIEHLDMSVMLHVCSIPQNGGGSDQPRSRVAVLFSGGIDSTVVAYLAHRHVQANEPIDLLNVAFENPRKVKVGGSQAGLKKKKQNNVTGDVSGGSPSYLVPDRVTGLQEVEELRRLCPDRVWNFVEIDVPYAESQAARTTIEQLMWPRETVMDLSLAMALYFAARGVGRVRQGDQYIDYTSPARVLLNGLGSDELMGGYGRHQTAYTHKGWQGVIDELQLELDRIPTRNLGRDDRVISSHGKETRHPFLSLSVVNYLASLPVHRKLDPRLPIGFGDKTLLRLAVYRLGLKEASSRKKRAMQFGSHSARMESGDKERRGDLVIEKSANSSASDMLAEE